MVVMVTVKPARPSAAAASSIFAFSAATPEPTPTVTLTFPCSVVIYPTNICRRDTVYVEVIATPVVADAPLVQVYPELSALRYPHSKACLVVPAYVPVTAAPRTILWETV